MIKYELLSHERFVGCPTFTMPLTQVMTSHHFNIILWFYFMQVDEGYFHTLCPPSQKTNPGKLSEVLGSDDPMLTTFCTVWISCWFSKKQHWSVINITMVVTVTVIYKMPGTYPPPALRSFSTDRSSQVCFQGSCRTVWLILVTWILSCTNNQTTFRYFKAV